MFFHPSLVSRSAGIITFVGFAKGIRKTLSSTITSYCFFKEKNVATFPPGVFNEYLSIILICRR